MTDLRMSFHDETRDGLRPEKRVQPVKNRRRGTFQLLLPPDIRRSHFHHAIRLEVSSADPAERLANRDAPGQVEFALRERPAAEQLGDRARHERVERVHVDYRSAV